jgi:hypothetical protein
MFLLTVCYGRGKIGPMYRELHGNTTPVEREALAWVKAHVKLLSSKQEPDIR